jgi:hypothetical protein
MGRYAPQAPGITCGGRTGDVRGRRCLLTRLDQDPCEPPLELDLALGVARKRSRHPPRINPTISIELVDLTTTDEKVTFLSSGGTTLGRIRYSHLEVGEVTFKILRGEVDPQDGRAAGFFRPDLSGCRRSTTTRPAS